MAIRGAARYPAWATVVQARKRANLTVDEVAERTGYSADKLTAIESANHVLTTEELYEIVNACGFELRIGIAEVDPQRKLQLQGALARTPSERIAANTRAAALVAQVRKARRHSDG